MWRTTSLTPAKVYLAPDAVADGDEDQAQADVFSGGAIAYHILTGRPPVTNPFDLPSRLREDNGPLLAGIMNGAGRWLEELVRVIVTAPRSLQLAAALSWSVSDTDCGLIKNSPPTGRPHKS